MAIKSTPVKSALSLRYKDGVDAKGKDIIKAKKFSNIKVNADDQGLMDVAAVLAPLMMYPLVEVQRSNDNVITNA